MDGTYGTTTSDRRWNQIHLNTPTSLGCNNANSLTNLVDTAIAMGKQVGLPEWGCQMVTYGNMVTGQAGSFFLQKVRPWLVEQDNAGRLAYEMYFSASYAALHTTTPTYDPETGNTVARNLTQAALTYKDLWD